MLIVKSCKLLNNKNKTILYFIHIQGSCGCGCPDDVTTTLEPPTPRHMTVAFHASLQDKRQTEVGIELITFDCIVTNIGGLLDQNENGNDAIFTIPTSGIYYFEATSIADGNGATPLELYLNDNVVLATGRSDPLSVGPYPIGTNHVILALQEGDQLDLNIKARVPGILPGIFITFSSPSDITFSAYLIAPL